MTKVTVVTKFCSHRLQGVNRAECKPLHQIAVYSLHLEFQCYCEIIVYFNFLLICKLVQNFTTFTMPQYPNLITAVMSLAKENETLKCNLNLYKLNCNCEQTS